MDNKLKLFKKVAQVRAKIEPVTKGQKNPHFKSSYFDINGLLAELNPILFEFDLLLIQPIEDMHVVTRIIDFESGEYIESKLPLTENQNAQQRGSEITYFRRYTLQSLLSIQSDDDDDGNAATSERTTNQNEKAWFNIGSKEWNACVAAKHSITKIKEHFKVSKATEAKYLEAIK